MLSRSIRIAAILTVFAVVATSAFAQSLTLRASIPFAFTTGDNRLPAGDYRLSIDPIFHRMLVQQEGGPAMYLTTTAVREPKNVTKAALVFNQYGNHYFLHAIYDPARSVAIEWPQTNAERELAKTLGRVEVAVSMPVSR